MDWGRILLVALVGLGAWRFRRLGGVPRTFWVALAIGASFWFLAAFNAIPEVREPTTNRYQYPGAVFLLLIAAELLRGVRPNRRALAVGSAVTALAVLSGLRFLHLGYENMRKPQSDLLRAQLAAIEIARDRLQPGLVRRAGHDADRRPALTSPRPTPRALRPTASPSLRPVPRRRASERTRPWSRLLGSSSGTRMDRRRADGARARLIAKRYRRLRLDTREFRSAPARSC